MAKAKAKRNENGKIVMFLGRDLGSNMTEAGEYDTLAELREAGRRALINGATCAGGHYANEFAFRRADGTMSYEWPVI